MTYLKLLIVLKEHIINSLIILLLHMLSEEFGRFFLFSYIHTAHTIISNDYSNKSKLKICFLLSKEIVMLF